MSPEVKATLLALFIQYGLVPVIIAVLTAAAWALLKAASFVSERSKDSKMGRIGTRILHLARTVVSDLEATMVPELRKATLDGKLTQAEVAHLRGVALLRLKMLAGQKGLAELQAILGIAAPSLDAYLSGVLEQAHLQLQPGTLPVASVPSMPLSASK